MSRLLNAVYENDLTKIKDLLARKPESAQDIEALCQGIGWGRTDAVKLLLQHGADVNKKDQNGNHPLKMACLSLTPELFHELIRNGSDPKLSPGLAADAAAHGRNDILEYLYAAGFDICQGEAMGGQSPLDAAIGMGHIETVAYLLECGADTSLIDLSKPLDMWKGALPEEGAMAKIHNLCAKKTLERLGTRSDRPE